jgi:norsolorinic acid ketoreductase
VRDNTTVVAAVRNPQSAEAKELSSLPTGTGSKLIVVKVDAGSDTDALEAVKSIKTEGVTSLDIVIANAGIFDTAALVPVADVKIAQIQEHLEVNTVGPIRLFQATLPLLLKSSSARFILMSTGVATIGGADGIPLPIGAYGASKAAANFFVKKITLENETIASLAVDPGYVARVFIPSHTVDHTKYIWC